MEHIENLGDRPSIIDSHGEYCYSDLALQIKQYHQEITSTIQAGEIVALQADYNFYSIALMIALLKQKVIVVPIVSNNDDEISSRIKVADCNWVLKLNGHELVPNRISDKVERHELIGSLISNDHAGLILFSSGTTGEPKAMIHNFDHLVDSFIGKRIKKLNMLVFLMFDHIGGLNTLLNTLSMGAQIVLPENRNPEHVATLIEKHKVHVLPSTPTFLNMMLMAKVNEKFDLKSLKMITYGTETMPESVLLNLKRTFPRTRLMQTFGTSETGIAKTTSRSSDSLEIKLDDPNTEYKIVNNELWLRSKTQVVGYLNADMSSFTSDGWFQTGDLVEVFDDNFIKIVGRSKEVINVGGEKVLPAEVESIILELDIVGDCMVYAEKNSITGQMVAVQIVLSTEIEEKEAKKLIRSYCKSRLDTYKVPVKFKFSDNTKVGSRFKKLRLT